MFIIEPGKNSDRSLGRQDTSEMNVPRNQGIYRKKIDGVEVHQLPKRERG